MTDRQELSNGAGKPAQAAHDVHESSEARSFQQKIQIQVTTKKKKEVISLDSSSEKHMSRIEEEPKVPEISSSHNVKAVKLKKTTYKCQLCKGTGKKVQMKTCWGCKNYSHINCLEENEVKKKYLCDKCRMAHMMESKLTKKLKKQEQKNEVDKATLKKIEKEKKKDESNRTLQVFKQKYPYYIGENDKIKFPIEDKLLFIYKDYFEPSQNKPFPIDHPFIPSEHLGDLLELENFLVSFGAEIEKDYSGQSRKSGLYILMNCEGTDRTFEQILAAIIKIYLKDIFQKNKTENVKILNDHCFFILLGIKNEQQVNNTEYISTIAPEIIQHLSNVPSMKNAFKEFVFPTKLNFATKLKTLVSLVQGLSEVDGFHDMVSRKSQKISEMTKDKADFVTKLKKNEAEALSNKEKLKQMLVEVNKQTEDQRDMECEQKQISAKETEKTKKKTVKMATQGEQSDRVIKDFKSKIVKIARMIPFVISETIFLGNDRNKSQHFFFLKEPHRIYVRYHNYLLDPNENYKIYEGQDKINELMKSLNNKGIHEKRLYDSIHFLVKENLIRNLSEEEQIQESGVFNNEPLVSGCVLFEDDLMFRQKIISDVMETEQNFSNYLAIKNCQWASDYKREEFKFGFPFIEDKQALKQAIKGLQQNFLFVEVVKEREVDSDSNKQENGNNLYLQKQKDVSKKKKPIRIWGINSEKIKRFWIEYLETCKTYAGIWISTDIFKNYVQKYLEKKMEHIREQQRKQNQERDKQAKQRELFEQREREKEERNLDRLRSRDKKSDNHKKNREVSLIQANDISNQEGMRTRRNVRASTRLKNKALTIDSDDQNSQNQEASESNNDDECALCHDIGEVICCDSCPKVFHIECLKLKEVPEGQWNCYECLYKMTHERQTRSRARKMNPKN